VKKITTPVRSAGPTGQAGICLIFLGLFFEHNPREIGSAFHRAGAEIGPRLNIKYGFNWASKKTIYRWELIKKPSTRP
jgi:hypothetical protein